MFKGNFLMPFSFITLEKVFSFLSKDEVEKLKQEEEKKIATLRRDSNGQTKKSRILNEKISGSCSVDEEEEEDDDTTADDIMEEYEKQDKERDENDGDDYNSEDDDEENDDSSSNDGSDDMR